MPALASRTQPFRLAIGKFSQDMAKSARRGVRDHGVMVRVDRIT